MVNIVRQPNQFFEERAVANAFKDEIYEDATCPLVLILVFVNISNLFLF